MGKPIEQRIGGPNSLRSLRAQGFYEEGSSTNTGLRSVIINEGRIYHVMPVVIRDNPGRPNEQVTTYYKPIRPSTRRR